MNKNVSASSYWKKLAIFAIVGGSAVVLCFCALVIFSPSSNNQSNIISATVPPLSAIPSATATPNMLSCGIIDAVLNDYLDKLTWDQYHLESGDVDLYIKSLVGKEISFHGVVDDVVGDTVFINDDSCEEKISVSGIPESESILFAKGSSISGEGTVGVFSTYQIIHVDAVSYEVEK